MAAAVVARKGRWTMTNPSLTLTSYNMGEVEERDFDMWVEYVSGRIDEACGFTVDVDAMQFGEAADQDRVSGAADGQEEAIHQAVRTLWDDFCATGWNEAYRAAGVDAAEVQSRIDAETENQILSVGNEFLPLVARLVRDGAELTGAQRAEYDTWIAGQVAEMGRGAEVSRMTTMEQIKALRTEAGAAGDMEQVATCDRALAGDVDAIEECRRVVDDAAASAEAR